MSTAKHTNPSAAEQAQKELENAVPKAAQTLANLLEAEDERIRIRAAEAILDRAGVVKAKRVSSLHASRSVGGEPDADDISNLL